MAAARADGQFFQQEQPFLDGQFDIFDWYPYFQSCIRYFLEHAQYNGPVQALAAFINIQLPFQKLANHHHHHQHPLYPRTSPSPPGNHSGASASVSPPPISHVSLQPYIRRLVATGFDFPAVLHGFFGDDWQLGITPLHEQERRNFLFAAKSSSWLEVKGAYDMGVDETVPFLKPLRNVTEGEIVAAEGGWSEWLAMQDWMLGPRSVETRGAGEPEPPVASSSSSSSGRRVRVKREEE